MTHMKMSLILSLLMFFTLLDAKDNKVVYDCSSSDAGFIKSRMWLVGKTMDMMKEQGDTSKVILTLHGGCVSMVSEDYDMIVPDEDMENIKQAQAYLKNLSQRENVKIIVCAMSLSANAIGKKEVLPFIHISKNSFIDTIKYQNEGYALMTFK